MQREEKVVYLSHAEDCCKVCLRCSGQNTHRLYDSVVTVAVVEKLLPGDHSIPVQVHLQKLTVRLENDLVSYRRWRGV